MKKRMYLFIALFAGASGLYAQDCATGYCPSSITVHHKAGDVSPASPDITYSVIGWPTASPTKCWITRFLGATTVATGTIGSVTTTTGWYFQYNRKQGYALGTAPPTTSVIDVSAGWTAAQDPCTILLGSGWHIPTYSEMTAIIPVSTGPSATINGLSISYSDQLTSTGTVSGTMFCASFLNMSGGTNAVYTGVYSGTSGNFVGNSISAGTQNSFPVRCCRDK